MFSINHGSDSFVAMISKPTVLIDAMKIYSFPWTIIWDEIPDHVPSDLALYHLTNQLSENFKTKSMKLQHVDT